LLPAANFLQLDYVKDKCVEFLKRQLHPSNCLGIKAFSDLHNCMELLSSSEAYIKKQFLYDIFKLILQDLSVNYINYDNCFLEKWLNMMSFYLYLMKKFLS